MEKKLIHNASMPRSGSELLQVLLHQNPEIYGSPTSPLMEFQYGARANTGLTEVRSQPKELMTKAFTAMCGAMVDGYYGAITDRPIVIDKNRGWATNYHWVNMWNPQPKMIVMTRDLRGIFASLERIYRANQDKAECAQLPTQLEQRLGAWGNMNQQNQNSAVVGAPPLGIALNRLRGYFQDGTAENILFVKYEDLCKDPKATMSKIYAYLGLDEFDHDFENIVKEVEENTELYGVFGDHNVSKAIKEARGWDDVLPAPIADQIRKSYEWYYEVAKYA